MTKRSFPDPPEHDAYAELAAGWALHALEPHDETRFAEHLETCDACQRAVSDYSGALAELSYLSPAVEPPAALGERIRAEVARELHSGDDQSASQQRRPDQSASQQQRSGQSASQQRRPDQTAAPIQLASRREPDAWRTRRWLVAAAAAVVMVLGVGNVVQYQQTRSAEERAEQQSVALSREREEAARRTELIRLLGRPGVAVSPLTAGGKTMAYVLVHDNQVQILTDGMARNDRSQEFVLWMVGSGGNPRAMYKFDVGHSDIDLARLGPLPSVQGGISAFAVSIEPRQDGMPTTPSHKLADGKAVI